MKVRRLQLCAQIAALFVISLQGHEGLAETVRTKVTKANKGQFEILSKQKHPVVCFRPSDTEATLGQLSEKRLKPGAVWRKIDSSSLLNTRDKLLKKIKKAKGAKKKALKRKVKGMNKTIDAIQESGLRCSTPSSGEFIGNPLALTPYREQLTNREVQHVLDKVAFGGNEELRQIGRTRGLTALVNALIDGVESPQELQTFNALADSWVASEFHYPDNSETYNGVRIWTTNSLQVGQMFRMVHSRHPLKEWMTFILSAHFAVNLNRIDFSFSEYGHYGLPQHWQLLRDNSLGNWGNLLQGFWRDPAMGVWLDNINNHAGSPNQNYPRELIELFTLGILDPVTGIPNYDERSVDGVTAFASGYYESQQKDPANNADVIAVDFSSDLHDNGVYTIFPGVPGAEYTGNLMPEELINHILFRHPGAPRYVAERLAGQILYPGLGEEVLAPLAALLISENYELKPFLRKLLTSQALFSAQSLDACISSPVEQSVSLARRLVLTPLAPTASGDQPQDYYINNLIWNAGNAGQFLFEPPSVFSWKGSCNINRSGSISKGEGWLTTQRQLYRQLACGEFLNQLNWMEFNFLERLGLSTDASAATTAQLVPETLFAYNITSNQRSIIEALLVDGFDDDTQQQFQYDFDLSQDWFVRKKIPRLVCLFSDLEVHNRK